MILDERPVTVTKQLRVVSDGINRTLWLGDAVIADEADATIAAARHMLTIGNLVGKSVAWIGGGLCAGPRLFAVAGCKQVVFEIEPTLAQFCPDGVRFIHGDYRDTLTGTYDVIVYNLGGEVPYNELRKHLNDGGVVLPMDLT